jgi:hypothetical protein
MAAGFVWTAIGTRVTHDRGGVLWLRLSPTFSSTGALTFNVAHQGYVAVSGASLLYPAISATSTGKALLTMSLVGPTRFPSTAYSFLTPSTGVDAVHVSRAGSEPEDGFTCYVAFVGSDATDRGCRWGDYSGVTVGTDGLFYFGSQYNSIAIPDAPFSNWETSIARVSPA